MPHLPQAFVSQMQAILGADYPIFEAGLATPSPTSIRYNTHKKQASADQQVPWCMEANYLTIRPDFAQDPHWHGGAYYVQEAGSMFTGYVVSQLLPRLEKPIVLDLCAAPGGKSTHLASLLHEKGLLVSNEVVKARLSILQENLIKWGFNNAVITHNDPSYFSALENFFDIVVIDAPCSGEGLFRKQPEAVQEWSESQVQACATRQQRILEDIWPALRPGGFLIYSTCTYNTTENEDNVRWLTEQFPTHPVEINLGKDWQIATHDHGAFTTFRFYPHRTATEGFFLTVLQKRDEESYKSPYLQGRHTYFKRLSKEEHPRFDKWLLQRSPLLMKQPNGTINLLPADFYEEIEYLARKLRVVYTGTEIAEIKGKDANPMQGLANSVYVNKGYFPQMEVPFEEALHYLSKNDFRAQSSLGHNLVTYEGLALGWCKQLPNRINNYYPTEWRLRNVAK